MTEPPMDWIHLHGHKRDILTTLSVDGPASGAGLNRRLGGEENVHPPTTHAHLETLIERGLVSKEPKNGREDSHQITRNGQQLLNSAREWMNDE